MPKIPDMDLRMAEVVRRALSAINKNKYAVGGAMALRGHGIVRETRDLDVFLLEDARYAIFDSLRKEGFKIFAINEPIHFWAVLPKFRRYLPDYRVDLLITVISVEMDAIENPVISKIIGKNAFIFPATELAASKFISGRPQDLQDLIRMVNFGLVEFGKVKRAIQSVTEDDAIEFQRWWSETFC